MKVKVAFTSARCETVSQCAEVGCNYIYILYYYSTLFFETLMSKSFLYCNYKYTFVV